jgi:putative acetyltransferase
LSPLDRFATRINPVEFGNAVRNADLPSVISHGSAVREDMMQEFTIRSDDPALPEVRQLIEELDAFLVALYPPESNHLLPIDGLRQPNVTFLTARMPDRVIGCGALVNHSGEYGELKRMFVRPEFRGLKVGRRILAELELRARASKLPILRLETGISQHSAIALYENAGYGRIGPFGSYREDPLCIYLEKHLV